jgi:hypothetical protein
VLGAGLLVFYLRLEGKVSTWLEEKGLGWQVGTALVIPLLLLLCFPRGGKHIIDACATLMGVGAGVALEKKWIRFDSEGLWWRRIFRFLLGMAVLFVVWKGLDVVLGDLEPQGLYRFVRYLLVGLWVGAGGPWLFVKTGLAGMR